jgi:hypothetical protein
MNDIICIAAWVPFNEGWGQFESVRVASELVRAHRAAML